MQRNRYAVNAMTMPGRNASGAVRLVDSSGCAPDKVAELCRSHSELYGRDKTLNPYATFLTMRSQKVRLQCSFSMSFLPTALYRDSSSFCKRHGSLSTRPLSIFGRSVRPSSVGNDWRFLWSPSTFTANFPAFASQRTSVFKDHLQHSNAASYVHRSLTACSCVVKQLAKLIATG
ncbi:hypothetical protein BT69DRAFT_931266 [Atractiella rhizophila]|nr:hypothetical protein BT69DRAFT_931266 [Atractiella rhizophila]